MSTMLASELEVGDLYEGFSYGRNAWGGNEWFKDGKGKITYLRAYGPGCIEIWTDKMYKENWRKGTVVSVHQEVKAVDLHTPWTWKDRALALIGAGYIGLAAWGAIALISWMLGA